MKRCWIHIGMHKTGSTTIQRRLGEIGRGDGWNYITVEKNRRHLNAAMFAMFASQPRKYHEFRSSGATPEDIARKGRVLRGRLERAIRESTEDNLILSAESLDQMDREGVERLAEFLRPLVDDIHVIGYVRPPGGLMSSRFQEQVKHGKRRFQFSSCTADYRFRFEKYDEVFGLERVTLIKFDPNSFTNQCVLADFSERVGITLPEGLSSRRVNKGLCRQACGILYAYNQYGAGFGSGRHVNPENRLLVRSLTAMKGDKFLLAPEIVAAVNDANRDDIRWMEERLGASFGGPSPAGVGIECERDLLHIETSALREFARAFEAVLKVAAPPPPDPSSGVIPPEQAAAYFQSCGDLVRTRETGTPSKVRRKGGLPSLIRRLRRAFGGSHP
ncbi:MAG: hypothetical protein H7A49_01155 [Akkermansiaceae bacterium]|nr:hypothetical protein [Akkermansiaceae bacterium]MCP5542492.1 hypothetical protein [Akkermansiaceae bacterium]MCP5545973.1 hypothetical protein [Akkermansiaceae bacterium]